MSELQAVLVPVTPFAQNCAVLWETAGRAAVVVDPGGDVDRILAAIDRAAVAPDRIWLTHGHLDHAGGAEALRAELARRLGRPVPIEGPHEADRFLLDGIPAQAAAYGIAGLDAARPDRWLVEGDALTLGDHRFAVLHCPGHTPGHLVFHDAAARVALVGDVLFRGSVGRTDFPYGDGAALLAGIRRKLLPLGDEVAFLCGHGPGSTFGEERRSNPFLRR